jgi:hypothetical protein
MNMALPALLDDFDRKDVHKRVAALNIWAALAQDGESAIITFPRITHL